MTGQRRTRRRRDNLELAANITGIILMLIALWILHTQGGHLSRQQQQIQRAGRERLSDLRAGCRRTSQRTAADVNLNWLYYQSEILLSQGSNTSKVPSLSALSPGEQGFLEALIKSGNPGKLILQARAAADFDAAYTKALGVDSRDAGLVHRRTQLGNGETPYQWVLRARFSCDQVYR